MEKRFKSCGFNLSNVEQAERWIYDIGKKIIFGYWDFDKLTDLLNEQDEKIKELEEYRSKYIDCLDKQIERENATHDCLLQTKTILDNLKQENQQLKQSQNSKTIEVLERLRNFYNSDSDNDWIIDCCKLDDFINNQITELKRG